MNNKDKVDFILSIDTEEEWDWSGTFPTRDFRLDNIRLIPELQEMCNSLGVKTTYFVDHAVADNADSVALIRPYLEQGQCEIGAHLHPWCNPPIDEEINEKNSHVVNLDIRLVEKKLSELTDALQRAFTVRPTAFRTGRWGIDGPILKLLADYGYTVDSSVYPFYSNEFFTCQGASLNPYWPSFEDSLKVDGQQQRILEMPVTVGFNRANFELFNRLHEKLSSAPYRWFHPIGLAWHMGIFKKIYLCPELSSTEDMKSLIDKSLVRGQRVFHMYLHSSSLLSGATGFMDSKDAFNDIAIRITNIVKYLTSRVEVNFCTITESANRYMAQDGQ
ncbi:WalW protein [Hahella sp. CCB-MM4]|uniref:polysaccharide deacetylase family protein n=1 Tax=Hahella sp. (strain CCB-MM4) TaxID=1926491 RepID=UPI000B9A4F20|nr:polysaccharide deacetylase family protein [Hahella sp. CCB-MM4]OZG73583.1 WalW protein [Hahella sp. CCB-MM4]